ncbi:ABC transporter substrate-binding protein [Nitratireductor indicus]|uniref:ABC transporter substrate-binding protein n=1 Tax=Nitratireductor indicus TaxID=721133 RepID=UPI002875CBC2|nr:ABC transporter substrate-binding protein [Nitratireductor indicus]MDS1137727.1 ABC transporter substrate-binding protein [Nitratireductor indicus]
MRKLIAAAIAATAVAFGGSAAAQNAPKDPDKYRAGAILAMSGKADWYGKVMSRAIQLAVDEINEAGGIEGIPLEVIIEDHKSGIAKEGVSAMNRLINIYDVKAVLTSFSPPTLAIAPIADEKGILLLNGGGTSAALVGATNMMFHNRSLASDLGLAAVQRAKKEGLGDMAQLVWKNDAGDSVVAAAAPYWEKEGHKVVATEFVELGASNIDTQVAKIRASRPDWVGLWLFSPESGLGIRKLREFGVDVPLIGIEYTGDVKEIAGKYAEGYEYASDYFIPSDDYPWSKRFADAYEARFGEKPEFYAANYYENVYVLAEAIRRARAKGGDYWDGRKLAEAIRENPTFDSVYGGSMTYQDNGVAKKRVAIFKVENGEGKFVEYVTLN